MLSMTNFMISLEIKTVNLQCYGGLQISYISKFVLQIKGFPTHMEELWII